MKLSTTDEGIANEKETHDVFILIFFCSLRYNRFFHWKSTAALRAKEPKCQCNGGDF